MQLRPLRQGAGDHLRPDARRTDETGRALQGGGERQDVRQRDDPYRRPRGRERGPRAASARARSDGLQLRKADSRPGGHCRDPDRARSEEHTSELQSLMRISYAVFCLKKKKKQSRPQATIYTQTSQTNENTV